MTIFQHTHTAEIENFPILNKFISLWQRWGERANTEAHGKNTQSDRKNRGNIEAWKSSHPLVFHRSLTVDDIAQTVSLLLSFIVMFFVHESSHLGSVEGRSCTRIGMCLESDFKDDSAHLHTHSSGRIANWIRKTAGIAGNEINSVSSKLKCQIITRMINEHFSRLSSSSPHPRMLNLQSHTCRINPVRYNALNFANN